MAAQSLEKRVAALERELKRISQIVEGGAKPDETGWKRMIGSFANDPLYEKAMRLGRKYRESLRPKAPQRRKKNGHS